MRTPRTIAALRNELGLECKFLCRGQSGHEGLVGVSVKAKDYQMWTIYFGDTRLDAIEHAHNARQKQKRTGKVRYSKIIVRAKESK